jgi:hypothetical protein
MEVRKYDLKFLSDEKNLLFDAVVISKVFINEIIFNVSVKAIGKSFKHIAIVSKLTSCFC